MGAPVCFWTDSQQQTGFFSSLLLCVFKSAAALRKKIKQTKIKEKKILNSNETNQINKENHTSEFENFQNWWAPGNSDKPVREHWTATTIKPVQVLKTFSQDHKITEVTVLWKAGPEYAKQNQKHQFQEFLKTTPKISHRRQWQKTVLISHDPYKNPIFHYWHIHLPKLLIRLKGNYTKEELIKSVMVSFKSVFQNLSDKEHHTGEIIFIIFKTKSNYLVRNCFLRQTSIFQHFS